MAGISTVTLLLAALIFIVALLYSTVGHAGASGYLAAMALFGMAPAEMKPTALVLNILVACIGSVRFYRGGFFSWRTFWPFAIASIPMSFIGGAITLPDVVYKSIVGAVLLYSAVRLFFSAGGADIREIKLVPVWIALIFGATIGLLSGLTGVGGGIFLSPILLLMHWAKTKETSGISATFILVNSIAGLTGYFTAVHSIPSLGLVLAIAAIIGGTLGSHLGSRHFPLRTISLLLATVLIIAGAKLMFTS